MARWLYTFLLYLLIPVELLRLTLRGRQEPDYLERWSERFGRFPATDKHDGIWLHAVSLGETIAAAPLIKRIREHHPDLPLTITTTTPTGSNRVRETYGNDVFHVYAPYDLPTAVRRFLERVRPRLAIIMETELWPNLLRELDRQGIPSLVANARLSERSFRGYRHVRPLLAPALRCVTTVAAQGQADADRYIQLGTPERVVVTGNLKFDLRLPATLTEEAEVLRGSWGRNRPIWIAASTHEGEDEIALAVHQRLLENFSDGLLVLVPRHPARFDRVFELCRQTGLPTARRSQRGRFTTDTRVFLGDTMGELPLFYAASDLAFVGGSLVESGGHNPLEPAALGLPVLFGPHTFNFREISAKLLDVSAACLVADEAELATTVTRLLGSPEQRSAMGERGREVVESNRGALGRLSSLVEELLRSQDLTKGQYH